jgi:manganese transport protein
LRANFYTLLPFVFDDASVNFTGTMLEWNIQILTDVRTLGHDSQRIHWKPRGKGVVQTNPFDAFHIGQSLQQLGKISFFIEIMFAKPNASEVIRGFIPHLPGEGALYIAIGIIGATVMPHNLYLHSSIVQTRAYERNAEGQAMAIRFATIDSTVSLLFAFLINAAILIVSAATFHGTQYSDVADISYAYQLLSRVLPYTLAGVFFAVALLASGQNSTLTGTMAGQIVMEGFLELRLRPWVRRMITRLLAIGPAAVVAALYGERGVGQLIVLSQVILALQLSFAVIPLVWFTSDARKMGRFTNPVWLQALAWLVTLIIVGLNGYLLVQMGSQFFAK